MDLNKLKSIAGILRIVLIFLLILYFAPLAIQCVSDRLISHKEKHITIAKTGIFTYKGMVFPVDSLSADSLIIYSDGKSYSLWDDEIGTLKK